jgi:hypothetical protein
MDRTAAAVRSASVSSARVRPNSASSRSMSIQQVFVE